MSDVQNLVEHVPDLIINVHHFNVPGFCKQNPFSRISSDPSIKYLHVFCEWTIANIYFVNCCASAIFVSIDMVMAICKNYYISTLYWLHLNVFLESPINQFGQCILNFLRQINTGRYYCQKYCSRWKLYKIWT